MLADEVLTSSHTAGNAEERQRVIARGGEVPECATGEALRVNGVIEVTRSLGDRWLKPVLDNQPDVFVHQLTQEDAYVVMGSDGLFDYKTDESIVRPSFTPLDVRPTCLFEIVKEECVAGKKCLAGCQRQQVSWRRGIHAGQGSIQRRLNG